MADESLYTTQTPDSLDNAEDTYTMGTELVFAVDGVIKSVRWRSATNAISTSPNAKIYDAGGSSLATKAAGVLTAGNVWNTITFDTPLDVTAGTYYIAAFGPINRYSALSGLHSAADLTNGNITAPQDGSGGGTHKNGRFVANAATTFPTSSGGAGYFVDVVFEADAGIDPVTGDLAASTPVPTAAFPGSVEIFGPFAGVTPSTRASLAGSAPIPQGASGQGWQSLLDIVRDARATRERLVSTPPSACPNDGEPLRSAPDGGLFCPFDGWRPRR